MVNFITYKKQDLQWHGPNSGLNMEVNTMDIAQAQSDVRTAFLGGFMGQLVSGVLWLTSAALGTWSSPRAAILFLVIGGIFIFPLTQFGLRIIGARGRLEKDNPLHSLGWQVAFTLPLSLPVVGAAALYKLNWFYPAFMVVLGAHYLPFVFLYGMRMFAALCGILVFAGISFGLYLQEPFSAGGWFTGVVLLCFAVSGRIVAGRDQPAH